MEQPEAWQRHHAALASCLAISSMTCDEREGIHLAPVEEAGQEQPEQRGVEERPLHRLGEPALLLGPLAQVLEERGQRAGPLERARAHRRESV